MPVKRLMNRSQATSSAAMATANSVCNARARSRLPGSNSRYCAATRMNGENRPQSTMLCVMVTMARGSKFCALQPTSTRSRAQTKQATAIQAAMQMAKTAGVRKRRMPGRFYAAAPRTTRETPFALENLPLAAAISHLAAESVPAAATRLPRASDRPSITRKRGTGEFSMSLRKLASIFLGLLWFGIGLAHDGPRERDARGSLFRADSQLSRGVGRANAQDFLEATYAAYLPGVRTELHRVAGDVAADGSLGYTFGWLDEMRTRRADGVVETAYGRYVAVWARRDRDWQMQVFLRL